MRLAAFRVERIHAIIPDERISHCDDLTAIGRISQHLLVAGHGSVEANFTDTRTICSKIFSVKGAPIFEDNKSLLHFGREYGNDLAIFQVELTMKVDSSTSPPHCGS